MDIDRQDSGKSDEADANTTPTSLREQEQNLEREACGQQRETWWRLEQGVSQRDHESADWRCRRKSKSTIITSTKMSIRTKLYLLFLNSGAIKLYRYKLGSDLASPPSYQSKSMILYAMLARR